MGGGAVFVLGEMRNIYKVRLIDVRQRLLGSPKLRWEVIIKIDFT